MRYLIIYLCLIGCNSIDPIAVEKNTQGTILIRYEKSGFGEDEMYYLKSEKCIVKGIEYDLINWESPSSELIKNLREHSSYRDTTYSSFAYLKLEDESHEHSMHIYHRFREENEIEIIFNFIGDVMKITKKPTDKKYGLYNHYSCPITLDTLNAPFYKLIRVDSFYTTPKEWLESNNYYKSDIISFKVNYCD